MAIVKPLILGARGNMGRRYGAIMDYLGVPYYAVDDGDTLPTDFDGVLIATPTALHKPHIEHFASAGVPILCEKPIAKTMAEVDAITDTCTKHGTCLEMVDQYKFLASYSNGQTYYDYFRHGTDGLYWDCINIIGNARGVVTLGEKSPIWTCQINGVAISLANMDGAYIQMIRRWLNEPESGLPYIYHAHEKTAQMEAKR